MSTPAWPSLLDTFEQSLEEQCAALEAGSETVVPAFDPPADMAPLPPHLRSRAVELVQRCRNLEDSLRTALDAATVSLANVADERAAKRNTRPVYFDSRI